MKLKSWREKIRGTPLNTGESSCAILHRNTKRCAWKKFCIYLYPSVLYGVVKPSQGCMNRSIIFSTLREVNRKWRCLEISRLADEICLTGSKVRDLKVCQPNVEMHCIQNYDSDSSDGEDEKQETTDDLTAHLKPLDPDKKSITTIALNAAPVIATKASLGIWKVILNFLSCFEHYSWRYIFILIPLIVTFIHVKTNKNVVVLNKVVM